MSLFTCESRPTGSTARFICVGVVAFACAFCGCSKPPEITEYTAPKGDAGRPFSCTVPKVWTLVPNDRFSDLAFESKTGAKVTVSVLSGTGNDFLLMNVNRWRGQVTLPPVESLDGIDKAELRNGEAKLVELASDEKALKGALVEHDGETWIFKLSGTVAAVTDQADEFSDFLKSVEFFENNRS